MYCNKPTAVKFMQLLQQPIIIKIFKSVKCITIVINSINIIIYLLKPDFAIRQKCCIKQPLKEVV